MPFSHQSNVDKLPIKELGPPRPNSNINQVSTKAGGHTVVDYQELVQMENVANTLIYYPCVWLHPDTNIDTAWTKTGVSDIIPSLGKREET